MRADGQPRPTLADIWRVIAQCRPTLPILVPMVPNRTNLAECLGPAAGARTLVRACSFEDLFERLLGNSAVSVRRLVGRRFIQRTFVESLATPAGRCGRTCSSEF